MIAAFIDAHKNAIIAHEADVLNSHFLTPRRQLFDCLRINSEKHINKAKGGYFYNVPNQYSGRHEELIVIGDKKGAGSVLALKQHPDRLSKLAENLGLPIKILHVIRNPYDNIASMNIKYNFTLQEAWDEFWARHDVGAKLRDKNPTGHWLDLWHEDFIDNPESELSKICSFLSLPVYDGYLDDCASIVYDSPHQIRHKILWDQELKESTQKRMSKSDFLRRYTWDN
jgi:hypothetical protein